MENVNDYNHIHIKSIEPSKDAKILIKYHRGYNKPDDRPKEYYSETCI